jgi:hypothetical protein
VYEIENSPEPGVSAQDRAADELSPAQHRALRALLTARTIAEAAEAAGLNESTVRRYLAEPGFGRAYREQQRILLSETTATLQRIAGDAAAAIEDSLAPDIEDKNLRLRAARTALEFLLRTTETERKVRELEDVEERLTELERAHRLKELGL